MIKPSNAPATIHFDDDVVALPTVPVTLRFDDVSLAEVVTEVTFSAASHMSEPRSVMATSKSHLVASDGWTWQQLRDYVVEAITARTGAFPRNPVTEASIFKAFCDRWGDKAELIAKQAVEVHQCWWRSAPLSVGRFCKGSDQYFAEVIAATV